MQSSDPRDKIYALLGLVVEDQELPGVDYHCLPEELYLSVLDNIDRSTFYSSQKERHAFIDVLRHTLGLNPTLYCNRNDKLGETLLCMRVFRYESLFNVRAAVIEGSNPLEYTRTRDYKVRHALWEQTTQL
jgi:hypothetical protein